MSSAISRHFLRLREPRTSDRSGCGSEVIQFWIFRLDIRQIGQGEGRYDHGVSAFLPRAVDLSAGFDLSASGTAISTRRSRTWPALGSCGESNEPTKTRLDVRS